MLIDKEFSVKETLLLHKGLPELDGWALDELVRIETLDVKGYTEADVRAEIIDPIVRLLGYRKGQFSSVDREKHIRFLGKTHKYIDYTFTLWQENFWIIEAKRPLSGDSFGYSELSQATEYAIHPEINASIIVLCDGVKLEIFDRDEDLESPIVSLKISNISKDFDLIRKVLTPVNIWFFYKRRILRSIDKAFEFEFNQSRANEFLEIIERRFTEKRGQILKNFQSMNFNTSLYEEKLAIADPGEIIDVHYFMRQSRKATDVMNAVLLRSLDDGNHYRIFYKLMPTNYRDYNSNYYMHLLDFLIKLDERSYLLPSLPCWLFDNKGTTPEVLVQKLIGHMVNYFKTDEPRKIILHAASIYRRVYKMMSVVSPELQNTAEVKHLWTRLNESEFSWGQILSSPERNVVMDLDRLSMIATARFVKKFSKDKYKFNSALAKHYLKELWALENAMFNKVPNYLELVKERDYGEVYPTEVVDIIYDNLGHSCLCMIEKNPKWRKYVIENHREEVIEIAALGSWSAQNIIGKVQKSTDILDTIRAQRFFFGDVDMLSSLKQHYGYSTR